MSKHIYLRDVKNIKKYYYFNAKECFFGVCCVIDENVARTPTEDEIKLMKWCCDFRITRPKEQWDLIYPIIDAMKGYFLDITNSKPVYRDRLDEIEPLYKEYLTTKFKKIKNKTSFKEFYEYR